MNYYHASGSASDATSAETTFYAIIEQKLVAESQRIGFYDRASKTFATEQQRDFFARSVGAGETLASRGVSPGDVVVVATSNPRQTLSAFIGAVAVGAHPMVVAGRAAFESAGISAERLRAIADAFDQPMWMIVDPAKVDTFAGVDGRLRVLEHPGFDVAVATLPSVNDPSPSDICFFQLTSGSTGAPKPVAVTHQNMLDNVRALAEASGVSTDCNFLSWLPLHHDMGLVAMALNALVNESNLYLMAPFDFMSGPVEWLRWIDRLEVNISGSPSFCFDLILSRLPETDLGQLDLSSWTTHYWGAEPVDFSLVSKTYTRLAPYGLAPTTLRPSYGLAEATVAVSVSPIDQPTWGVEVNQSHFNLGEAIDVGSTVMLGEDLSDQLIVTTAGKPLSGLDVVLIDATGVHIDDEDTCGEIVVDGSGVAQGYYRPDGSITRSTDGRLHTGDLGFFHDGHLFVVDRLKNIVIRNGVNYPVAQLEDRIARRLGLNRNHLAVLDSDLRAGRGLLHLLIELPKGQNAAELLERFELHQGDFEPPIDRAFVISWGSIPTTTSGKKRYPETRKRLQEESFNVLQKLDTAPHHVDLSETSQAEAERDDLARNVIDLVAEMARARTLDTPVLASSSFRQDLGFDSIAMLELAVAVEKTAEVTFPEEALGELRTVDDLIALTRDRSMTNEKTAVGIADKMMAELDAIPQMLVDVDAQTDRLLSVGQKSIIDFASVNYLGFDLHPTVIQSIQPAMEKWGVHPSWCRAVASPQPYRALERGLSKLVGVADTLIFPTLTLQHIGILPVIAANGTLIVDNEAHNSIAESAELCSARGIKVVRVNHRKTAEVERVLSGCDAGPKIIAVNGVYSTSGTYADLPNLVPLAERYAAQIYVDDAHGFGIVGERPDLQQPWGYRGNGIVNHFGLGFDNIIYAGGLSKAYSTMGAFITVRNEQERLKFSLASTAVFSGPTTVAAFASGLAGLGINEIEGDDIRSQLLGLTQRLVYGARDRGFVVDNATNFPIVTIIIGGLDLVRKACDIMWEHNILLTPSAFPAAPLHRGGLRLTLTVNNTVDQVDKVLAALTQIRADLDLPAIPEEPSNTALFSA